MADRHLEEMLGLDSELAAVARPIRILERLAWPPGTEERFLEGWRAGRRCFTVPGRRSSRGTPSRSTAVPTIPTARRTGPAWTRRSSSSARRTTAVNEFFTEDQVAVVLDPHLASKAIAGSKRIRVRDGALFSELDFGQLLNHEAFIHTATMLNGKRQPSVRCLGLGAPRTTRTQEGLAVLAELMTLALSGADFLEVFRGFLEAGQSEEESYKSAQRIFRGGDVRGGIVFTKDCVYLKGLLEVHAFLRVAIRENRPELVRALFAGRLTLGDAVSLSPLFEAGVLAGPVYVPPWARDLRTLASVLAYSAFLTRVDLRNLTLERFVPAEDTHGTA